MRTFAYFILWLTLMSCHGGSSTQVVITTKPRFTASLWPPGEYALSRYELTRLILADDKQRYELIWAMGTNVSGVFRGMVLDTNRVYTFTLHEISYKDVTIPELLRVQANGQIIYDVAVCEVHKTKMQVKQVRISYGSPGPSMPTDTERRLFPHCREQVYGGFVMTRDSPKTEEVYICGECKSGYEKWKGENAKTKIPGPTNGSSQ